MILKPWMETPQQLRVSCIYSCVWQCRVWMKLRRLKLLGSCQVVEMQSEAGAAGAMHGSRKADH